MPYEEWLGVTCVAPSHCGARIPTRGDSTGGVADGIQVAP